MKSIRLLTTGGTIASAPGPDGLTPQRSGEDLLRLVPGLEVLCQVQLHPLLALDSTNVGPGDWQTMAQAVWAARGDCDGIVIAHGTDTMAYSAAALHYMLENIDLPVILTGSQLPIEAPGSDGPKNLRDAFAAAATAPHGVFVVFHGQIIPGEAAYKQRTQGFDAFVPVNVPIAGAIQDGQVQWTAPPPPGKAQPRLRENLELQVGLLKLTPATTQAELDFYGEQGWKGLVVEGFGAGGVPERLLPALQRVAAKLPVVLCSQCRYDGVHLDVYDVGHQAARAGVLSGGNRTPEAWVVRLMWALANGEPLS